MYTFFVFVKPPFSPFEEMIDGETVQIGRGQDERPFNIESVTQVNIKKFRIVLASSSVHWSRDLYHVTVSRPVKMNLSRDQYHDTPSRPFLDVILNLSLDLGPLLGR